MTIFGWLIVGLLAGSVAQSVTGFRKRGCMFTLVVGVIGAFVGGALFRAVGSNGDVKGINLGSVFVAFIGGCVLCLLLKAVDRK